MDVVLIVPPFLNQVARKGFEMTRPMSLFCLAATLKDAGYSIKIKHFERDNEGTEHIEPFLKRNKAPIYGITCTTPTRFGAIEVIRNIKKIYPDSVVVVGGPHFQNCVEDSLKNVPEIDVVVRGDGDYTFLNLVRAIESKKNFSSINGISFRKTNKIFHAPDAPVIENLDKLPIYQDFDYNDYRETVFVIGDKVPAISVLSSRGCPFRCIFCSVNNTGYRHRSPEKVVDEIELWLSKFPMVKGINFFDLTFTANPQHAAGVCKEIMQRNLKIVWWAESRANIDYELLKLMKKAGCVALSVGVESGSPKVLQNISKAITIPQVKDFVKVCKDVGIEPLLFFMASFPDETEQDLSLTKSLINELLTQTTSITSSATSIYPGTRLEEIARERKILDEKFSWNKPFHSEVSAKLSAYPDIPIFIEKLTPKVIEDFLIDIRASRFKSKISSRPIYYLKKGIELLFEPGKNIRYKLQLGFTFFKSCLSQFMRSLFG